MQFRNIIINSKAQLYHQLGFLFVKNARGVTKRKISNQAMCLKIIHRPNWRLLQYLAHLVKPYDRTHIEPYAANVYFKALFGRHFSRRKRCHINSCLNYGYSLVRSMLARSIVISSLLPYFGIWHDNRFDTFALADDLIEPFRAIVDNFVIKHLEMKPSHGLASDDKRTLLRILAMRVQFGHRRTLINRATGLEVRSFRLCCLRKTSRGLLMPTLKVMQQ